MKKLLFASAAALLLVAPPVAFGRHGPVGPPRRPHIVIHPLFGPPNFTPPGPPSPPDFLLGPGPRRHFYVFAQFVGHYVWCDDPRYWDSWWWWTTCR
jgi:hypothetical protein